MTEILPEYRDREQSGIKHYALRLYLEAATRILGARRGFRYVDCCAGPWESKTPDYSDTSFGIAVSVFRAASLFLAAQGKTPKFSCLLIEQESGPFAKLEAYAKANTGVNLSIAARQSDFAEKASKIAEYCTRENVFPFIFVDPWGWKLAGISQITPLLKVNPGEILINLMSPFITRFLMDNKTDFTDLLGSDYPDLRTLQGGDLELEVVRRYCDLLKRTGGYKYVCALPVMNPDADTFNFHLIYATRHWKGVVVFKAVERRTENLTHIVKAGVQQRKRVAKSGNAELFGAEAQYREKRYEQLAIRNRQLAKSAVWEMINGGDEVSYDDCWAEALQMTAVYERDLRAWISAWEAEDRISVLGRSGSKEVLKINSGHSLLYKKDAL